MFIVLNSLYFRALENITGFLIRVEEIGPHFVRDSVTGVRMERNDS